ncbi:MAG TPA: hypothetical protein VGC39_05810 [Candidatus Methylacidiphilales bacterium]
MVLALLALCFCAAVLLKFGFGQNLGHGGPGGMSYAVATWRDYDDTDLYGLSVTIMSNQIVLEVPAVPVFKQMTEAGRWNLHAFDCDSHVDAPAEVEVARELKDEDLEVDIGRFLPAHPGKIRLVKVLRGQKDETPRYPVAPAGQAVSYPPPKGLIREGMLECDLRSLPWQADGIESSGAAVHVMPPPLSDGTQNRQFFPDDRSGRDPDERPEVYVYRSDRPDTPRLLATVYRGRVTEVSGGREETADIPYRLPASSPTPDEPPRPQQETWMEWAFKELFEK